MKGKPSLCCRLRLTKPIEVGKCCDALGLRAGNQPRRPHVARSPAAGKVDGDTGDVGGCAASVGAAGIMPLTDFKSKRGHDLGI